jgi:hypothetical protein
MQGKDAHVLTHFCYPSRGTLLAPGRSFSNRAIYLNGINFEYNSELLF